MMVRRKNLRTRQGSCETRARAESRSEKCIKFEGEGLPLERSRRVVVVDKPALKVMARERG